MGWIAVLRVVVMDCVVAAVLMVVAAPVAGAANLPMRCSGPTPQHKRQASQRKGRMKLSFERSGGFAGMATAVQGEVVLDGNTGKVTAGDYQRNLSPEEVASLRAGLEHLQQAQPETQTPMPDQYVYDLRIESNGHTQSMKAYGDSTPATDPVLTWVRQECGRIWDHRTGQK